jgi:hypothetical protein
LGHTVVTARTGNERDSWPVREVLFKSFSTCQNCIGGQDSSIHVEFVLFWWKGSCTKVYSSVQGHWESLWRIQYRVGLLSVSVRIELRKLLGTINIANFDSSGHLKSC